MSTPMGTYTPTPTQIERWLQFLETTKLRKAYYSMIGPVLRIGTALKYPGEVEQCCLLGALVLANLETDPINVWRLNRWPKFMAVIHMNDYATCHTLREHIPALRELLEK